MKAMVELVNVEKAFPAEPPVKPLAGIDLTVECGSVVAITGASGTGKSTLLGIMGGILRPDAGSVLYQGEDLAAASTRRLDEIHKRSIGFMFQSPCLFQALTVKENLVFSQKVQGLQPDEGRIAELLDEFGVSDRAEHLPCELSVGQKRRVVLARTLLAQHDLILADEPTNDLDADWSDRVFSRLRHVVDGAEKSVVIVTHDQAAALRADAVYTLDRGKLTLAKKVLT